MSGPLISIIIRCFNEEEHIGRLLSGIYEQSLKNIEVILVDSGSTDGTLSIAKRFPVIIQPISPENFSFGRALNIGCSKAKGEFLVFASAHAYPSRRSWLEYLIAPFNDPKVALAYGKQRGNETTKYSEHMIFARWFPDTPKPVQKTPFCNNANAAVRRSLWEELPFNGDLTGLEDLDWARRAIRKGYHLAYAAEAEVIHVHDEKYPSVFNRYYRESIVLHQLFPEQKFHFWNFLALWILNTTHDYIHAVRDGKLLRNIFQIPVFRFMQFLGTYRGYIRRNAVSDSLKRRFYYPAGFLKVIDQPPPTIPQEDYIDYSAHQTKEKHGQSS
jgi:rhamnosyltransferase